jgi:geranylgeranyl pyrophosphate synthase
VRALIQSVVTEHQVSPEDWRTIRELLSRHNAIDAAYERAVDYADRAKQGLLAAFAPSPERDGLAALTDYVLSRDK